MKLRAFITLFIVVSSLGCSSSSSKPETSGNALIGTWLSNCHEVLGSEDQSGNNLYAVSEITFTETEIVDRFTTYTDTNCTENPFEELGKSSYIIGESVVTTDGVEATRITQTVIIPDRPDLTPSFEAIYRISGEDINFGMYIEGEVPSIDSSITYTKQ